MADYRQKDADWIVAGEDGKIISTDHALLAVLMDLRDELKAIRFALFPLRHFECKNFLEIPHKLDTIVTQTKPRKKSRRRVPPVR